MSEGLIRVNGRARSIGPTRGGTISADEADEVLQPSKAKIYLGAQPGLQSFYHQETYGGRRVLDKLLQEMGNYDWPSVQDLSVEEAEKEEKLRDLKEVIRDSGINLDGQILEFDAGPISIGSFYTDLITLDKDPRNVKNLRREGIRAIIGSIDEIPIEGNSFDYVVAFYPLVARPTKGWRWINERLGHFEITGSDYKEELIERAIEIAREKALIVSVDIALNPPCSDRVEKRELSPYYYVVYDTKRT